MTRSLYVRTLHLGAAFALVCALARPLPAAADPAPSPDPGATAPADAPSREGLRRSEPQRPDAVTPTAADQATAEDHGLIGPLPGRETIESLRRTLSVPSAESRWR